MSISNVKTKASKKASNNKITKADQAALQSALNAVQTEIVPLSDLIKSPLNMRTIPYSVDSVRSLAETIASAGLLQNLIVHSLPDGKSGVAAGGRRLTAMQWLCEEGRLPADHPVTVKRVSDELAIVASYIENDQRASMHPAEQIAHFRKMANDGKTPAQIGDELGYGSRHVQRMLKLANLAPSLLELLASGELDVEQCQAICLEPDQARQVEIFESVKATWAHTPANLLKRAVTETEMQIDSPLFVFIGRKAYEAAGGYVREDLFSQQEGEGTADRVLVERLAQEKLENIAKEIQQREGWKWSCGRVSRIWYHGKDAQVYFIHDSPDPIYTQKEQERLDVLHEQYDALMSACEESDAIDAEIEMLERSGEVNAWPEELKAKSGVVASFYEGELCIQRGIQLIADMPVKVIENDNVTVLADQVTTPSKPDAAEGISLPLLTKMSSERTLAVQAALMQQPEKAVALMVWRMCSVVFCGCLTTKHPFCINLSVSHYNLTANAPSGKEGAAYVALMQEKNRLEELLPAGWEKDFTTFFTLDGGLLMSLMAFCTACSVDGVQSRENGHTSQSPLNELETAISFHLRDWWQPTKENFFSGLKHTQIVEALKEAGMTGAARDAEKMKKGAAAEHAQFHMNNTRWVPAWLKAPEPEARSEAPVSTESTNDDLAPAAEVA